MTLVVWIITRNVFARKEFQNKLPHLSPLREGNALYQITSRSGRRGGLAAALNKKLNHFNVLLMSLSNILHFLADCFHEGYEHRSTDSIRSAISVYQVHIEGNRVGKHPLLCSLMSGVFNGRPPKPRYLFVWDVVWEILSFVKVNWGSNSELSDKNMTYKVLILMALTFSPRAYASHHLIT